MVTKHYCNLENKVLFVQEMYVFFNFHQHFSFLAIPHLIHNKEAIKKSSQSWPILSPNPYSKN